MTIQEAIKSGHPFRRPYMESCLQVTAMDSLVWRHNGALFLSNGEDLMADDWEINPPMVVWVALLPDGQMDVFDSEGLAMDCSPRAAVIKKFIEVIE